MGLQSLKLRWGSMASSLRQQAATYSGKLLRTCIRLDGVRLGLRSGGSRRRPFQQQVHKLGVALLLCNALRGLASLVCPVWPSPCLQQDQRGRLDACSRNADASAMGECRAPGVSASKIMYKALSTYEVRHTCIICRTGNSTAPVLPAVSQAYLSFRTSDR